MVIHSTTLSVLNHYNTVKPASQSKQKDEGRAVTRREKKEQDRRKKPSAKATLSDDTESTIVIYA